MVDDAYVKIRRPLFSGIDIKGHPALIGANKVVEATNLDFALPGKMRKRQGFSGVADDLGADNFEGLVRYNPIGGSDVVMSVEDTNWTYWDGSNSWAAAIKTNLTASLYTRFIVANDLCFLFNGTDNVHSSDSSFSVTDEGNTNADPPLGTVGVYFRDRLFVAKNGLIYYSDAGDPQTFDRTTNFFRVNVGDNDIITNLVPFRNDELIIFKEHSIWLLTMPTSTVSSWYLQPVDMDVGCVSKEAAVKVGDDIFFWSEDGVRSLARNEQDKIKGVKIPLSDPIFEDYVDNINKANKSLIRAIHFQNRVIFGVPNQNSTNIDRWFVYFLQEDTTLNGWAVWDDLNINSFVKYFINGEERLYFSDGTANGQLYRMFDGTNSDNGAAIDITFRGRFEDIGDQNLHANRKKGYSLYLRAETAANSILTIDIRFDEGVYINLGTMDLSESLPQLPQTLPFDLGGKNVVVKKFNNLPDFTNWYNCQIRITQSSSTAEVTFLEYMILAEIDDYETD